MPVTEALQFICERPVLVVDRTHADVLVGLLTSSDIMKRVQARRVAQPKAPAGKKAERYAPDTAREPQMGAHNGALRRAGTN